MTDANEVIRLFEKAPKLYTDKDLKAFAKSTGKESGKHFDLEELEEALEALGKALQKKGNSLQGPNYAWTPANKNLNKWTASDGSSMNTTLLGIIVHEAGRDAYQILEYDPSEMETYFVIPTPDDQADYENKCQMGDYEMAPW